MKSWKSVAAGVLLGAALGGLAAWQLARVPAGTQRPGGGFESGAAGAAAASADAGAPDPLGALTAALAYSDGFARAHGLYRLAGQAGPDELAALIVSAAGMVRQPERLGAMDVFFQRYATLDPGASIRLLKQLQLGDLEARFAHVIFRAWAETDPKAAIKAVRAMSDPHSARIAGEAVAAAIRRDDPVRAADILASLPGQPTGDATLTRALAVKAADAPQDALADALAITDGTARRSALRTVADAWARTDPAAALKQGQSLPDPQQRVEFLKAVVDRWARADADGALGAIVAMDPGPLRHPLREVALGRLAEQDPAQAYDWAQRFERGRGYSGYSMRVLAVWAGTDPHAAAARITDLPSGVKLQAFDQIGRQFGRSHPRDALAWAGQQKNLADRMHALAAVAETVASSSPDLASGYILAMSESPERNTALSALVAGLARNNDTARAATLAVLLPAGEARQNAVAAVAHNWALRDPYAALRWAGGFDGQEQQLALNNVVGTWSQIDLPGALRYVAGSDEQGRVQLLSSVISPYVTSDPLAAMRWLDRYEGEPGYENALSSAMYTWGERDPTAAARYAANIEKPSLRETAVAVLMQTWSQRDPVSAADWIADLEEGPGKRRGVQNLVAHLARMDRDHAEGWVLALDSGPSRDEGLRQLANNYRHTDDPERALEWINEIGSDDMRFQTVSNLVRNVSFSDSATARALLRAALLTPAQRILIENRLDSGG